MNKFKNNELASYFLTHWKFSFNLTIWALRLESFVTIESLHDEVLATAGKIKPRAAGVLFSGKAWEMSNKIGFGGGGGAGAGAKMVSIVGTNR